MSLLQHVNETDIKKACIKCGSTDIKDLNWCIPPYDWQCNECKTYQLTYIKSKGFRYYAFLLQGSWTSRYYYARSYDEGFRLAQKDYGKEKIVGSYLVGPVDSFSLNGWFNK